MSAEVAEKEPLEVFFILIAMRELGEKFKIKVFITLEIKQ